MAARWSCSRCTFENEPHATSCGICLHKRAVAPPASKVVSSMKTTRSPVPKKPRTNASSSSARGGGGVQSLLLSSVGSSKEQEAKRLAKKVQQMRELGIELSDERIEELLARNCYSVHVAASEYFERMTRDETASDSASDATQSAAARAAARDPHVATSVAYFEKGFLGAPFRLLGSTTAKALITRANARLSVGDRLLFQGENVGKKRARPSSATTAAPPTATSVSNSPSSTSSPSAATPAGSASANGIVRVSTTDHVQLGRLDRDLEVVFHPLLKEGLVSLGGVCVEPPFSKAVFASFSIVLFVYVHPRAFDIFQEDHALFHLSDALYYVLDSIHSGTGGTTPLTQALSAAANDGDNNDGAANEVSRDLETLFSAFTGASSDDGAAEAARAADEVAPMFSNGFELRSHQKQALSWMLWREKQAASGDSGYVKADTSSSVDSNPMWEKRLLHSQEVYYINPFEKIASFKPPSPPTPCLGGILADDMGMGKTIMLLSLITHRKYFGNETTSSSASSSPSKSPSPAKLASKPRIRAGNTLIVCPLSLLHQWKNEVEERFRAQTLSVLVYYGDERGAGTLSTKSDIVLTTYGVLCSEFEKSASSSVLLTTHWDRVILDEAHSIKTRTTTYFRACSSLRATHRWCLTGTPLQNSLSDLFSLLCFLRYEPWSRVAWWQRVIARPFEQGDEDALARLKVLLKPILLRRTKLSRDAHGNNIVELPPKTIEIVRLQFSQEERTFYQAVYDRSRAEFNGFVASGTSMSSYIAIFALLLRLRQACNHPFLALGRNSELADTKKKSDQDTGSQDSSMSQALRLERLAGESMESYFRRISSRLHEDAAVVEATTSKQQSSSSAPSAALSSQYIQNVLTQIQEEGIDTQECPVCLDPPRSGVLTPCAHLLCEPCLRDSVANDPDGGCPVCRVPVEMSRLIAIDAAATSAQAPPSASESDAQTDKDEEKTDRKSGSAESSSLFLSAKLRRLVQDLQTIREEDARAAAASAAATPDTSLARRRKVVVFSQWTHMLEMVAELLAQHGFGSCMFHGAMSQENREKVLRKFHQDESMDVLVISLKAGGVGLNLTCASVVVLLDPWWNPGVEDQAIDRVHRLGQTRAVVVKRYVVEETVEQMILQLQERKEKLAKNVLVAAKSADDRAGERLGMEDLLAFFKVLYWSKLLVNRRGGPNTPTAGCAAPFSAVSAKMLTRARARATNQHVFVDDKWNDAYIQTKDEQIDMLHAQRVLKGWEDDADSEAEEAAAAAANGEEGDDEDEDRWISEESGDEEDEDEEDEAAKAEALKQQQRRRRRAGNVLAGGGFVENVLWTAMAATVAPVVLYSVAARVGLVGRKRRWPLQSASLGGALVKAYLNVATVAVLLGAAVWGVCSDVLLPLSLPVLRWRSLLRLARRVDSCAAGFVEDWQDVVSGGGGAAQLPLLLLNRETQRLVAHAALLLGVAVLLTQFYRLWLKSVVLLSTIGVLGARVASHLRAEQRSAIEILALDPNFAFANESIFIAIDGQNLEQGATVAWVPYWGVLQHLQAAECDKLFAQPLRNGGVRVAFDQLNEFVPCYAARGDDDDFKCFEHLRLRVKDQKSVPGWSLHALPAAAARPSDEL